MARRLDMTRFLMLSLILHFIFAFISEILIDVTPPQRRDPIKVSIVKAAPRTNVDFETGKIVETPKPEKEEKADDAAILAEFDSKANARRVKNPEKRETSIPKKSVATLRKARPDRKKKPPTNPMPTEKVIAKPPRKEDTVTASIARPFTEKVIRPKDIDEKQTSHLQFEKTYDRTLPKAPPVPEERRQKDAVNEKPKKAESRLEGDRIDLFVKDNPHNILETDEEIVISLNTKKFEYFSYFKKIRRALEEVWEYPDEAILDGLSGRSLLRFTLSSDGRLLEVKIVSGSGEDVLDEASIHAIEDAQPFESFPQALAKRKIHIVATFTYDSAYGSVP